VCLNRITAITVPTKPSTFQSPHQQWVVVASFWKFKDLVEFRRILLRATTKSLTDRKVLGMILRPPGPLKVKQGFLTFSDHADSLTCDTTALQAPLLPSVGSFY
jgi:hypothetical protein